MRQASAEGQANAHAESHAGAHGLQPTAQPYQPSGNARPLTYPQPQSQPSAHGQQYHARFCQTQRDNRVTRKVGFADSTPSVPPRGGRTASSTQRRAGQFQPPSPRRAQRGPMGSFGANSLPPQPAPPASLEPRGTG
jgi:hypothetical protein